jgi:glycosyltransferase involved in cell wall biosynthesis
MTKSGFVIPVANEEKTIGAFLDSVCSAMASHENFVLYLIMDNYSKDGTKGIVEERADRDQRVRLVWFPESTGPVSCRLKGFKVALEESCDIVIEMDSGFSHPPEKLAAIHDALSNEQVDVVFMSRFLRGGGVENFPFYRRVISWGGSFLSNLWLGTRFSDATSGFQAFKSHVLRSMDLDRFVSVGGIYSTEMKYYCSHFRYREIPFTYVGSTSNFRLKWVLVALKTLLILPANKRVVVAGWSRS